MLQDRFGRIHDYVRISITDKCSLRCVYCMPEEGLKFFPDDRVLSKDEIIKMVGYFADMGVKKVRLTGGEPLMRHDVQEIIQGIANIPAIEDIALTTNGLALARQAALLSQAGLKRLNISLDTFNADRYREMTRGGNIKQVLRGIEAASQLPFTIKINTVVINGQNDQEIVDFLHYSIENPVNVRFIEFMPMASQAVANYQQRFLPLNELVFQVCRENGWTYQSYGLAGNGPSENYQISGAKGSFGLIHPVSCRFCESCNRLRITADGCIKSCLYWDDESNIREALASSYEAFCDIVQTALNDKPENHEMALAENARIISNKPTWRHMSQIGG